MYPVLVKMVPAGHQSLLFISWEGKVKGFGDIPWFAGGMKGGGGRTVFANRVLIGDYRTLTVS